MITKLNSRRKNTETQAFPISNGMYPVRSRDRSVAYCNLMKIEKPIDKIKPSRSLPIATCF